jgi:transcriptional regulator GlxA family with amidase domain
MKHVSIVVPAGNAAVGCIEGAYTLFNKSNDFLKASGKPPFFTVQMVGLTNDAEVYDNFRVYPDLRVDEAQKTDLIIIPAVNGDVKKLLAQNSAFLPWIVGQYKRGSEVASLCVGAYLLAATGLLKKKECATHWLAVNDFRKLFPDTKLIPEKIIADEHGIYSSGGGNSFWNLLLYLIEKYTNRELAIQCAKYFEIDLDRHNQAAFDVFSGPRNHHDESVKKAQLYIERNFRSKITVDHLSALIDVGRRTLERRFKKATYYTVSEYIHKVKMEEAKKNFEIGRKDPDEVMRDIGYSDPKAFRTIFKRTTGLSPIEYRNKYNKGLNS